MIELDNNGKYDLVSGSEISNLTRDGKKEEK